MCAPSSVGAEFTSVPEYVIVYLYAILSVSRCKSVRFQPCMSVCVWKCEAGASRVSKQQEEDLRV